MVGKRIVVCAKLLAIALFALTPAAAVWAQDASPVATAATVTADHAAVTAASTVTSGGVLAGQYIVVLQEARAASVDMPDAVAATAATVTAEGGAIHYTYDTALHGFAATLPTAALTDLQHNPAVAWIEPDRVISATATVQTVEADAMWGLDRIDQHDLPLDGNYSYDDDGAGVNVYLIDTGINATHVEVAGRVGVGYAALADGFGTDDCSGHGTHVAGIVGGTTFGVAKAVTLHPVRVLDCNGEGSYSAVLAGIDWVTRNHVGPSVANMSLGGPPSAAVDNAILNSIASGVTYVVAAGNAAVDACTETPARLAEAIVVGASTQGDSRASFSNYGSCVDLFAPGQRILSAFSGSDTATAVASGTSMAAPFVTGAVALYLQAQPSATPAQVANALLANATVGHVTDAGSGSPNLLLYTNFDSAMATPLPQGPSIFLPFVTP